MDDRALPSAVRTTCPYCGVGCGVAGRPAEGRGLAVAGDAAHPANRGRLCSKGSALGSTVGLEGRLLYPEIGGRRVSWDRATATVARRFSQVIARHGPDAVAFYVSGQLLTEDYYAANKLMKGFIGSANIDTNSRLCMASAVAAHKLAFGADLVPGCYEDLELAELVVFAGHNAAWTHPVLVRRMEAARAARGQAWVVIDPRRTDTAEMADLHLALKPQTDVRLWNGLLAWLVAHGAVDRGFIAAHTAGFAETLAALGADDQSPAAVAGDCDLAAADVERFFRLFAAHDRTVSLFSQGSNQSAQGVAKGLAVLNAHLATGRIGRPGAAPFSITGQPNAMGGRETGGMANTLAAHMDFTPEDIDRAGRFWGSANIARAPGLKAVDMFEAVADGRIKAVWIMATNPAVSLPRSAGVGQALARCPFVVVSEVMAATDTLAHAHVKLPALAWGEKDGTVTNSERRISRQRPLFAPPGEARADWRIIADVGRAMGFAEAFDWRAPAAVFSEYARMTAFENHGRRVLNLKGLTGLSPQAYERLAPVQWPVAADGAGAARLFADGRFATADGRARLKPVRCAPPAQPVSPGFPFALNTGRVRDHWHTLTRTGLAPELCRHAPEPMVEVHPEDAAPLNIAEGALVRIITPEGEAVAPARLTTAQRRGEIFLPMHWTAQYAAAGRANPLVAGEVDPISGQPEFKHSPARLGLYRETWRGFLIARTPQAPPPGLDLIWRRIPQAGCQLHEFAGRGDAAERAAVARRYAELSKDGGLSMEDAGGALRRALFDAGGRLDRVLCLTVGQGRLPPRDWLVERFADAAVDPMLRAALLVGRAAGSVDRGPLVCACRNVGLRAIEAAIDAGARDLDALGAATGAGITCGSCRPELKRAIAARPSRETQHAA
jgi:assimilatory nitrate reductase catalytic subunit